MLVFLGLISQADKFGRFEWRPKTLKLDILPFLKFDLEKTLLILVESGFVTRYEVGGKHYGQIENFSLHQRVSGKELQEPSRIPSPRSTREATEKHLETQEGNGLQEVELEQEGINATLPETPFLEKEDVEPLLNPPKNSDQIIENILRLHPANWHWKNAGNGKLEMPHSQLTAVIGAIGRHQWTAVLEGTKVYGEFINLNPGFVLKPERFYGPEIHYLKTKEDWEHGNGKSKSKGDDFSERAEQERNIARAYAARNRG